MRAGMRSVVLFASVSALTFAACAVERRDVAAGSTADAGSDAPPLSRGGEREPLPTPPVELPCPREEPLARNDLVAEIGWKPPRVEPTACTAADRAQFGTNIADPNVRLWTDLGKGLSPSCAACVVTNDVDPIWGVLVVRAGTNGADGFVNVGGCAAASIGEGCGEARHYEEQCLTRACRECTTTRSDRDACYAEARTTGMCAAFASEVSALCGDAGSRCSTAVQDGRILELFETLCGPKDADGGA